MVSMRLLQTVKKILESYSIVITTSLLLGMFFSSSIAFLAPYSTPALSVIFFIIALQVDLKQIIEYFKDFRLIAIVTSLMLIVFPFVIYYLTNWLYPDLALAFLILAAMPTAMAAALVAGVIGGRPSLALVFTVVTSLLAPVTVPLVIQFAAGTTVAVNSIDIFLSLGKVIFIPFIVAEILKWLWPKAVGIIEPSFKSVSMVLLGLIFMSTVALQADAIFSDLSGGILVYLVGLFILFIGLHLIGYFAVFWRDQRDRLTVTVCLTYMNFILALYLAQNFFNQPNIVVPIILTVLPWSILVIPFKFLVKKLNFFPVQ